MSIPVRIKDVINPRFISATVKNNDTNREAFLHIYTGTIPFFFPADNLDRSDVISFVPMDDDNNIFDYQDQKSTKITVVSSLTSFHIKDTTFVGAVDSATVQIADHSFKGKEGSRKVLVLRAKTAVRNGEIGRIAYQVTVLAEPKGSLDVRPQLQIDGELTPFD